MRWVAFRRVALGIVGALFVLLGLGGWTASAEGDQFPGSIFLVFGGLVVFGAASPVYWEAPDSAGLVSRQPARELAGTFARVLTGGAGACLLYLLHTVWIAFALGILLVSIAVLPRCWTTRRGQGGE
jgi:hypothetical protein